MTPKINKTDHWLEQDALVVAPRLLGWELIHHSPDGDTGGRIVEVEAYHGEIDPASHAYRGRSGRNLPMFEAGGTIYVYLSYGIHTCMNIVTGPAGEAQAVLIRALEPTIGLELIRARRRQTNPTLLASGPGKLTQALAIGRELSGSHLGGEIELRPPRRPIPLAEIATGPRIGISRAVDQPWRFWLSGDPNVSRSR